MATTTAVLLVSSKIIASGFLLGLGFWGSKRLTNYLDYRLALRDPEFIKNLQLGAPLPV